MRAQLVPLEGGDPIEIAKDMSIIGRQEDCEIRVDHKSVSKLHCVVVKADGAVMIRDLGSTNGTRVNGTRVRRAVLLPNDRLSIANFHYRVLFGAALTEAAAGVDHTQQLSAKELAHITGAADAAMDDSEEDLPVLKVQANALPDVYPEEKKGKG